MPQFKVFVYTQCATPGTTPDLDNTEVKLPRRMLLQQPPFMSAMLEAAKYTLTAESAFAAASAVIPEGFSLGLVNEPYIHREINGVYVKQADLLPGETADRVFVLQSVHAGVAQPWTKQQIIPVKTTALAGGMTGGDATGTTKNIQVEFRVHLLVRDM